MSDEASAGLEVCDLCDELLTFFSLDPKTMSPEQIRQRNIPSHHEVFGLLGDSANTCPVCADLLEATENHIKAPRVWRESEATGGDLTFDTYEIDTYRGPSRFWSDSAMDEAGITAGRFQIGYCVDDPYFCFLIRKEFVNGPIRDREIWAAKERIRFNDRLPVLEDWLEDCSDNHDKCKSQARPNRQLPTRLMFLHEENGECFPRLVYTAEIASPHFKYTTLSHRWGLNQDEKPIQTTKETEITHSEGVTLHYLPRTFRDAVRISLAINVPYIWIDSLCIVQDDEQDWRREAARMGDIYEGSYLNIAALDSPNCNGGCALYRRKPATHVQLQNGSQVAIRTLAAHPADVFDSHLNTRGWIFQELTLPVRVLYCGKNQFYWQCSTKVYSEDGFIDHDMALNLPGTRRLEDFSKRNFTRSTDLLPALIGVTKRYQEETGLTPVLGLWKETLLDDLAWHTAREKMGIASVPPQRSNIPNMPTWSWMITKDCEILTFMSTEAQTRRYKERDENEDISSVSSHSQEEADSQKNDDLPGEENASSEGQSASRLSIGEAGTALPSRPKISSEHKNLDKLEPSRHITAEVLDVQVHWKQDPLNSDILSTKLILEGPLKRIQFEYDRSRRRLYEEGTESSHDSDTFVVRLDENQDFASGELISIWCLQLWVSIGKNGDTPTFLVLDEIENDGGVFSLRKFRRIGCGCLQRPTFDFEDAEKVALERV